MLGLAIGAGFGVTEAVIGVVVAQVVATALLGTVGLAAFRRFPQSRAVPLGEDRREIVQFVLHSSVATGVVSLRGPLAPMLLGLVTTPVQVGFFRIAQAPQQGLASLSAPARLILLTEQTRDWERGKRREIYAGIRRYTIGATFLMLVLVPPVFVFMPELVRLLYGDDYAGAAPAARLILLAGAIQLIAGWSKSFPVSIGKPGLRVVAHGIETIVLIPLVVLLGAAWDAEGAAAAVLVSSIVFAAVWVVLLARVKREHPAGPGAHEPEAALP
jgi:O-antigen/teichoic acid export membrane protein